MTPGPYSNRWRILASVMAVLIMAPVDGSAVNTIIPVIQQDFHVEQPGKVAWVQLAYLIVIGGLILPMGRPGGLQIVSAGFVVGAFSSFSARSPACSGRITP